MAAGLEDWRRSLRNASFVGRQSEMDWLFDRFRTRSGPIVISGPAGVGKTALLNRFLVSARVQRPPLVLSTRYPPEDSIIDISSTIEELYRDRRAPEIVAIDEADVLNEGQLNTIVGRVLNLKAVRTLIFVARSQPKITRAEVLQLRPLSIADAESMMRIISSGLELTPEENSLAVHAASGLPLALELLARLMRGRGPEGIQRLLRGDIYNLNQQLIIPDRRLIAEVKPRIILANNALVERLRMRPDAIYDLPPRKFEELVAELLTDLGYEVELTPATRDGGKDMLAYMTTPHGRLLCLVEAKKYRRDRPVGVELVRQLYGTLTDADASSAMLITTSRFSPDAHAFQRRHQYKLALRDYGSVVQWIEGYKSN